MRKTVRINIEEKTRGRKAQGSGLALSIAVVDKPVDVYAGNRCWSTSQPHWRVASRTLLVDFPRRQLRPQTFSLPDVDRSLGCARAAHERKRAAGSRSPQLFCSSGVGVAGNFARSGMVWCKICKSY